MPLRPFPRESRARWRRLDVPGREEACIEHTATGWRLSGELDVEEAGLAARLRYVIECDPEWLTRSALVEGILWEMEFATADEMPGLARQGSQGHLK